MSSYYQSDYRYGCTVIQEEEKITIKPRALNIVWGRDLRYWRVPDDNNPGGPAELLNVSWLQVTGLLEYDKLKRNIEYGVSFVLLLKSDAFGWSGRPVYFMVSRGKEFTNWAAFDLSTYKSRGIIEVSSPRLRFRTWSDLQGEPLQFGIYEIWKEGWKGGLIIHEVVIKPVQ